MPWGARSTRQPPAADPVPRHPSAGRRGPAVCFLDAHCHSPHQYGLYSAFMGCFVYFFLGTSRDVTLGPTAIMSLLVSFYTFHEPAYAVLLAFLSGCIQLAMGFLRLGKTLGPAYRGYPGPCLLGMRWASAFPSLCSKRSSCGCGGVLSALYCSTWRRAWASAPSLPSPWSKPGQTGHVPTVLSLSVPSPPVPARIQPRPPGLGRAGTSLVFFLGWPGFLLDFISCPVIKGFTSAATITIGFGQIKVGTAARPWAPPG